MMARQAPRSGLVMGFDDHIIAGSRACSYINPARSADHYQPDKLALCRGPGYLPEFRRRVLDR